MDLSGSRPTHIFGRSGRIVASPPQRVRTERPSLSVELGVALIHDDKVTGKLYIADLCDSIAGNVDIVDFVLKLEEGFGTFVRLASFGWPRLKSVLQATFSGV